MPINWAQTLEVLRKSQVLWEDTDLIEVPAKKASTELRFLIIGKINNKHWSAIITYRDKNIQVISVVDQESKKWISMKAKTLEEKFDDGENILEALRCYTSIYY